MISTENGPFPSISRSVAVAGSAPLCCPASPNGPRQLPQRAQPQPQRLFLPPSYAPHPVHLYMGALLRPAGTLHPWGGGSRAAADGAPGCPGRAAGGQRTPTGSAPPLLAQPLAVSHAQRLRAAQRPPGLPLLAGCPAAQGAGQPRCPPRWSRTSRWSHTFPHDPMRARQGSRSPGASNCTSSAPACDTPAVSPTTALSDPARPPTSDGGARAWLAGSPGLMCFRAAPGPYEPPLTPRRFLDAQVLPETVEAFRWVSCGL